MPYLSFGHFPCGSRLAIRCFAMQLLALSFSSFSHLAFRLSVVYSSFLQVSNWDSSSVYAFSKKSEFQLNGSVVCPQDHEYWVVSFVVCPPCHADPRCKLVVRTLGHLTSLASPLLPVDSSEMSSCRKAKHFYWDITYWYLPHARAQTTFTHKCTRTKPLELRTNNKTSNQPSWTQSQDYQRCLGGHWRNGMPSWLKHSFCSLRCLRRFALCPLRRRSPFKIEAPPCYSPSVGCLEIWKCPSMTRLVMDRQGDSHWDIWPFLFTVNT